MRSLARLTLAPRELPPPAPLPSASRVRSPQQLDALRQVVEAARPIAAMPERGGPLRAQDAHLARLGEALDWLDSLRTHEAPCEQPDDAAWLWAIADACKCLLPQLRHLALAAQHRDRAGVDRWASRASVPLELLRLELGVGGEA